MKVTYLGHSGFVVEINELCLVFDYFRGNLSEIVEKNKDKKWYVFSSHSHQDHFNSKVFDIMADVKNVTYILSKDIKRKLRLKENLISKGDAIKSEFEKRLNEELIIEKKAIFVRHDEQLEIDGIRLITFQSTDRGVAFLIRIGNISIYHAGDLNWWHWEGESKQFNNNMAARYKKEVEKIYEVVKSECNGILDVVFLPLDPRQENAYYMGMLHFIENVSVKNVFPMHFWDEEGVQDKFLQEYSDVIAKIKCRFFKLICDGEEFIVGGDYG